MGLESLTPLETRVNGAATYDQDCTRDIEEAVFLCEFVLRRSV
ncbi:MAG: hypothetical protein WCC17_04550 [Candidatus Nitrosopolaris sp.]|jgi:hypothetical protein